MPLYVRNVNVYTISGREINRNDAYKLGHAMSRLLRHVNRLGFAWADDVVAALCAPPYNLRRHPIVTDILWIVAREPGYRFQCVSLNDGNPKAHHAILIRCAQGHSGNIVLQMTDIRAYELVTEPSVGASPSWPMRPEGRSYDASLVLDVPAYCLVALALGRKAFGRTDSTYI